MYEYLEQVNLDLACVMQSYKCIGEDANRPLDVMNVDRVNVKTSGEPVSVWRGRREEYALLKLEEERLRKRHLAAKRKRAKHGGEPKAKRPRRARRPPQGAATSDSSSSDEGGSEKSGSRTDSVASDLPPAGKPAASLDGASPRSPQSPTGIVGSPGGCGGIGIGPVPQYTPTSPVPSRLHERSATPSVGERSPDAYISNDEVIQASPSKDSEVSDVSSEKSVRRPESETSDVVLKWVKRGRGDESSGSDVWISDIEALPELDSAASSSSASAFASASSSASSSSAVDTSSSPSDVDDSDAVTESGRDEGGPRRGPRGPAVERFSHTIVIDGFQHCISWHPDKNQLMAFCGKHKDCVRKRTCTSGSSYAGLRLKTLVTNTKDRNQC